MCYKHRWVDKLVPVNTAEALRIGSIWHQCREAMDNGTIIDSPSMLNTLEACYKSIPSNIDLDKLAFEQHKILGSFKALTALKQKEFGKRYKILGTEVKFDLPYHFGDRMTGSIDKVSIDTHDNFLTIHEYKSTSSSVEAASDFWCKLEQSSQKIVYYVAAKRMFADVLKDCAGIKIVYEAWKKPLLRPLKAAKKRTEPEKPWEYGVRICEAIMAEPHKYFNELEIPITDSMVQSTLSDMETIAEDIHYRIDNNKWFKNDQACDTFGKCPYFNLCWRNPPIDENGIPEGFKINDDMEQEL